MQHPTMGTQADDEVLARVLREVERASAAVAVYGLTETARDSLSVRRLQSLLRAVVAATVRGRAGAGPPAER